MKPVEININRLDYKNPQGRGFYVLDTLKSIEDLQDVNEVRDIDIYFNTIEEAKTFASSLPKSLKAFVCTVTYILNEREDRYRVCSPRFNTFWTNKTTGEKNESAIKMRDRWIKLLREL